MKLSLPNSSFFLAEVLGRAGQVGEGLCVLDLALAVVEETGERAFEAELHRLKDELLLKAGDENGEAEMCFQHALDVARRASARSWELRAAISLSRLWQKQGKMAQASELLKGVYSWFTEGFDTTDLEEAQAPLNILSP